MRLLIDANILLDVMQERPGYVKASSLIWKLCEIKKAEGFVSALTFANLVYVMRKELDAEKIEEVFEGLSLIFEFTELSPGDISCAAALKWDDFEDALQSTAAKRLHAGYIVTRNTKGFKESAVCAVTSEELLVLFRV